MGFTQVITVDLGALALARTRWALSPAADLLGLLRKGPLGGRQAAPQFWRDEVDSDPLVSLVAALAHPAGGGYQPDFLTPKPAAGLPPRSVFAEQLKQVASTPPEVVEDQVRMRFRGRSPGRLRTHLERGQLAAMAASGMARAWNLVGEDAWNSVQGGLREELTARAEQTTKLGLIAALGSLSPELTVDGVQLQINLGHWNEHTNLSADELVVVPRAFGLVGLSTQVCTPTQALLYYPIRPPDRSKRTDQAPAALIGTTRLTILAALDSPTTTTELSSQLGYAMATISYHLRILSSNGLVSRRRNGLEVLYRRTRRGSLLAGGHGSAGTTATAPIGRSRHQASG